MEVDGIMCYYTVSILCKLSKGGGGHCSLLTPLLLYLLLCVVRYALNPQSELSSATLFCMIHGRVSKDLTWGEREGETMTH